MIWFSWLLGPGTLDLYVVHRIDDQLVDHCLKCFVLGGSILEGRLVCGELAMGTRSLRDDGAGVADLIPHVEF
ncbi:MAG: hypothetical protein V3U46_07865, partial [Acidimicrobiia bacterium]